VAFLIWIHRTCRIIFFHRFPPFNLNGYAFFVLNATFTVLLISQVANISEMWNDLVLMPVIDKNQECRHMCGLYP